MLGRLATLIGYSTAVLSVILSAFLLQGAAVARMNVVQPAKLLSTPLGSADIPAPLAARNSISSLLHCWAKGESVMVERKLVTLDLPNPAADYDGWFRQFSEAETALRTALECSPGNGVLWAYRAYLMRQGVPSQERIIETLEMSRRLSPSFAPAIVPRAATWWSLSPDSFADPKAHEARDRDIFLFVRQAHPVLLTGLIRKGPPDIRDEILRLHEASSQKRKEQLAYALRISAPVESVGNPSVPFRKATAPDGLSLFDLFGQKPEFK